MTGNDSSGQTVMWIDSSPHIVISGPVDGYPYYSVDWLALS